MCRIDMQITACYDGAKKCKNSLLSWLKWIDPVETFDVLPATAIASGVALFLYSLLQRM
jgi:hypothetical protein